MAKGDRKQVEGLPQGWIWDYGSGEYDEQVNGRKTGRKLKGRHVVNYLSGDTLTVKTARNIQRGQQGLPQTPAPQGKQRTGKLRTTNLPESQFHGKMISISFRSLEELENFVLQGGIPDDYKNFTVQTRFKNSKIPGKEYPKGKGKKYRYATLTPFLQGSARYAQRRWNAIFEKAEEYEYNDSSRFYIFARQR